MTRQMADRLKSPKRRRVVKKKHGRIRALDWPQVYQGISKPTCMSRATYMPEKTAEDPTLLYLALCKKEVHAKPGLT